MASITRVPRIKTGPEPTYDRTRSAPGRTVPSRTQVPRPVTPGVPKTGVSAPGRKVY